MLLKLLKRTWLYKVCDRIRNIIVASHVALLHLVQRAPADNAVAESRQAALLREIRERSETTSELLAGIATRADVETIVRERLNGLERALDARLDALEVAFEAWRDRALTRPGIEPSTASVPGDPADQPVHRNGRPSGSRGEPELK